MPIALACPRCAARMAFPDEDAGRVAACPNCRAEVEVPVDTRLCAACGRRVARNKRACAACEAALPDDYEVVTQEWLRTEAARNCTANAAESFGPAPINSKALASLALGLMSFLCFFVTGVPAMILGLIALSDIRFAQGRQRGRGAAVVGVALGALSLLLVPLFFKVYMPGVFALRDRSVREHCEGNLTVIGIALQAYHEKYGSFPPVAASDASGRPLLSWRVLILPFLGEGVLYDQFHLDEPWDSQHNLGVASAMPEVYRCPTAWEQRTASLCSNYAAISGDGTVFPPNGSVKLSDIVDGQATTAMIVEVLASRGMWTQPDEVPLRLAPAQPGKPLASGHVAGAYVLMADGSVRFIEAKTDAATLSDISTIAGKEIVDGDSF